MCQTFFDVRMLGAVMSTGTALCGRVQGPLQVTFSRSVSPVLAQEHGLTLWGAIFGTHTVRYFGK